MNTDRHAILSLVAMGRITPHEAERLLAVWPDGEETLVRLAFYLAFAWLVLSHLGDVFAVWTQTLLVLVPGAHHTVALVTQCLGGL
ncbi:MAG TPA: hypothetical protein VHZ28_08190 [Terracidiphilus sp.]|jgi:hypothetical protein|nr:hypothetical protein [Terracidiphilus sp.]